MVRAMIIVFFLIESQPSNRGNGTRGPPSTWQSLRAPVAFAHLLASLAFPVDDVVPCSCSADGGVVGVRVCGGC